MFYDVASPGANGNESPKYFTCISPKTAAAHRSRFELKFKIKSRLCYRIKCSGVYESHLLVTLRKCALCVCSVSILDHPTLEPRHFVEEKVVNEHHQDYMFLECIKFINEVCVCVHVRASLTLR